LFVFSPFTVCFFDWKIRLEFLFAIGGILETGIVSRRDQVKVDRKMRFPHPLKVIQVIGKVFGKVERKVTLV
jgi:hypothetical protein